MRKKNVSIFVCEYPKLFKVLKILKHWLNDIFFYYNFESFIILGGVIYGH